MVMYNMVYTNNPKDYWTNRMIIALGKRAELLFSYGSDNNEEHREMADRYERIYDYLNVRLNRASGGM